MAHINKNLKFLRAQKGLTQKQLAEKLGLKQAAIGAYEEERSTPPLISLLDMSKIFNVSLDALVNQDLSKVPESSSKAIPLTRGKEVLAITVDTNNKENVELVTQKASAGYLSGYQDLEFIKDLPKINLPCCRETEPIALLKFRANPCCPSSPAASSLENTWKMFPE